MPDAPYPDPESKKKETTGKTTDYVKKIWEIGKQAGLTAKTAYKGKDEKEREKQIVAAVMNAVRPHLAKINAVDAAHHVGCMRSTDIILGICRTLGVNGEAYISKQGHTLPYFPKSDVGLKHGDDLYSKDLAKLKDAKDLMLSKDQINTHWNASDKIDKQIGDKVLRDSSNRKLSDNNTETLSELTGSTTVIIQQDGKQTPVSINVKEVVTNPAFKKQLVQDSQGNLITTPTQIVEIFNEVGRVLTQAGRGWLPNVTPANSRGQALSLLIKAVNGKLLGKAVVASLQTDKSTRKLQDDLRQDLTQKTYPTLRKTP